MIRNQPRLSHLNALTETLIRVYTIAKACFSWIESLFAVKSLATCTGDVRPKTGAMSDADVLFETHDVS